jgi:DNA-binding NtrC family response regulator
VISAVKLSILSLDDDELFQLELKRHLGSTNNITLVSTLSEARAAFAGQSFDVVLLDRFLKNEMGTDLISEFKTARPDIPIIVLTSDTSLESMNQCLADGATDYLVKKSDSFPELYLRIPMAIDRAKTEKMLKAQQRSISKTISDSLIGSSQWTTEMKLKIQCLKGQKNNILIFGETGTGKELIATLLNKVENDHRRPFITQNCAAIPESLFESEFFGYRKGAFTGATDSKQGLLELAHGGDLFLDEIGELSLTSQAKLLRAIEDKTVRPLGSKISVPADFRLIAATNRDLEAEVRAGRFREDLLHRIGIVQLKTEPLRNRKADIAPIAMHLIYQETEGRVVLDQESIQFLESQKWRGNVRALRTAIARALMQMSLRGGSTLALADFSNDESFKDNLQLTLKAAGMRLPSTFTEVSEADFENYMSNAEYLYLKHAQEVFNGSNTQLGQAIGMSKNTIYAKLKKYGLLDRPRVNSNYVTGLTRSKPIDASEVQNG